MEQNDYIGLDQFVWFYGVVEDRNDPLNLGRVRVRVYGWYSESKGKVPVQSLPWAQVIQSPTSAAMGDVGHTPMGLVEGSWVIGFFLDGTRTQRPVIMGSISGIPRELGSSKDFARKGFTDSVEASGTPKSRQNEGDSTKYPYRVDEPDVNRLARNDINYAHPVPEEKDSTAQSNVPVANSSDTWNELSGLYAAEYPYNHVMETESGHIREYDDTPDQERIHEYHKAGTFYEIDKQGSKVTRVVANNYTIIAGDDYVRVEGNVNLYVNSNCNTYIKGNWNVQVDGNKNEVIKGTLTQTVTGNVTETYSGNQTTAVTGNVDIDGARIDLN
jgi:hypothetical protein